jgi:transcriptional antiterminator NusG
MKAFNVGDSVRITRGRYASFVGIVEKVSTTKLALVVTVEIFGRRFPIAVGSRSVEKVSPADKNTRTMNLN